MYFIFQDHEAVEYLAKMNMSSDSKSSAFLVIELEIFTLLNKLSARAWVQNPRSGWELGDSELWLQ